MAGNSFLQSPFQSLIDQQPAPLPGSDPVPDVEMPDVSAAAPAPKPAPAARSAPPASLLPPESMRPLFEATAAHFKVPVNVLMAIAQQESSYNADATNRETSAAGIGQYLDATAKSLGINARDPNEAVPAIAMQLRERLDKGYDMADAVKEHFAGPDRKLWGEKTAAYGQEVLAKAGQIGQQLYGDTAAAPEAPPAFTPGAEQNQFAPNRMARADYEKEFRALNPKANDAAVQNAMAQYDQQAAARLKAKTDQRAAGPMKKIPTPEEFFDQRLNAKLQGEQDGVVPQLPAREQPVAFPETGTKHRPGIVDQARGDFGRGIDNLRALGYGAAGMAAEAAGKEDEATRLLDQYVAIQNDVAKNNPATIGSYKNIRDMGDVGRYTIEAVMENLPMILPSLATGGIGAQAAKVGAQRLVGGMIESQVAKGIARDVAERNAAQFIAKRVMMGSAAGAAPATIGMETGSIGGDIYQETGQKRPGIALGYGIPAGLLDTLEPVLALRKIAGPVVDEVAGGIIKRLGVEAGKQFIAEAGTEGLQTIIEEAGKTQASGKKLFTPELLDNVIDSALKGGLGGAGMGVMSEATHSARAALAQPEAAAPGAQPRIEPTLDDMPPQDPVAPEAAPAPVGSSVADQLRAIRPIDQPSGPLEGAVVHAAAAPTPADAGPMSAAIEQAADQHEADPAPAPEMPPAAPDYTAMPLEDLRAALKDVAGRAQQQPEQRKALMAERKQIEKEIAARGKQAMADSKPAVEPLSTGPFEDMKAANRMMQRYAEETGQPHEVVGSEGKFRIQPIEGARDGIDNAGTERETDGRGRSGGPAVEVGSDHAAGRAGTGTGIVEGERPGSGGTAAQRGDDAGDHRTGADGAADAQPALTNPRARVESITKLISHDDARAIVSGKTEKPGGVDPVRQIDAGEGNRSVLRMGAVPLSMFKDNENGDLYDGTVNRARAEEYRDRSADDVPPVIAVLSPRTGKLNILDGGHRITAARMRGDTTIEAIVSMKPIKETAHVPERPQVPEEAPPARGAQSPQPADAGTGPAADAGTGAAPAAEGKLAARRALNARQDEVVRAAAAKLEARKAASAPQSEPQNIPKNIPEEPQPAAAEAPAPIQEPARDVPRSFMKKVKVDHDVYIRDERRWETAKVPAHTALKSVREDIGNLEALLKCMKG